jgi:hypothetical protein
LHCAGDRKVFSMSERARSHNSQRHSSAMNAPSTGELHGVGCRGSAAPVLGALARKVDYTGAICTVAVCDRIWHQSAADEFKRHA